jgi:beta-aspartyl-peptidase (threonine type)
MRPARAAAAQMACEEAVAAGWAELSESGSAIDGVIAAVRHLEDAEACNAGRGAALTEQGTAEVDASLMRGQDLGFGAVAAMRDCRHPISVCRAILEEGRHAVLAGEGAWLFARERGFSPEDLIVERTRRELEARRPELSEEPGTVGACALDEYGDVAAATSTGGVFFKRVGRVGDTPLCGCGTYADNLLGAASATGLGEAILKITMARYCCDRLPGGASEAACSAVRELTARTGGTAGIIAVRPDGQVGIDFNTKTMPFAVGRHGESGFELISGAHAPPDDL